MFRSFDRLHQQKCKHQWEKPWTGAFEQKLPWIICSARVAQKAPLLLLSPLKTELERIFILKYVTNDATVHKTRIYTLRIKINNTVVNEKRGAQSNK